MSSTINASTTLGLISTADTSGILQLQTANTPALTLNATGAFGLGSSPSYGTSGQALLSNGSGAAPSWGTAGISTGKAIAMAIVFGG